MNFSHLSSEFQQPLKDELWALQERKLIEGQHSHYTLDELRAMPTLSQSQADNLKFDDGRTRVWLSRMKKADGAPYNNQVTVEVLHNGRWETSEEYPAGQALNWDRKRKRLDAKYDAEARRPSVGGHAPYPRGSRAAKWIGEARRSTDIGDGFYIHDSGFDVNGNWRVTISKGANRAVGIQTNGNADAAHHKSIPEIAADPRAVQELKDFYMNFIHKKNRSRGGAAQRTLPAGSDDWSGFQEADDKKVTALQNRISGLLGPQNLKAIVEPNTDKQAVVKPAEALEQAEEKTWADKVKSVLTTAKLKFQPQGTAYFIVDYPEDLKENRRVSQADLEDMIARFNAEGSDFRLAGSYGYLDLWTKTPDGKDVRLASGSRKDIYDALVKNRFKFREASPVDTLYIDLDNAIDFLERTFFNEDDVSFELKSAGHNKELGLPFAIMSIQIQPSGLGPRFAPVELDVKIQKLPGGEMRYSLEALPSTRLPQWTAIIQKNEGAVNNLEDRLVMAVKKVRSVLNKLLSKTESSRHAKFREVRK